MLDQENLLENRAHHCHSAVRLTSQFRPCVELSKDMQRHEEDREDVLGLTILIRLHYRINDWGRIQCTLGSLFSR